MTKFFRCESLFVPLRPSGLVQVRGAHANNKGWTFPSRNARFIELFSGSSIRNPQLAFGTILRLGVHSAGWPPLCATIDRQASVLTSIHGRQPPFTTTLQQREQPLRSITAGVTHLAPAWCG